MISGDLKINKSWTLFLDRDGVINRRIPGGYVQSWNHFEFLPGVLDAIRMLNDHFGKTIVVSNQQGVGKGLMTDEDVRFIHEKMNLEISKAGGMINGIYYCPALVKENSFLRKPNVGMALKAKKDFSEIRFKKSVMVGDSLSDMLFGKRLKMKTVMLSQDISLIRKGSDIIDFVYDDLISYAKHLSSNKQIPHFLNPSIPQSLII
jgi:histidinol-phosphate phosphatase family protein